MQPAAQSALSTSMSRTSGSPTLGGAHKPSAASQAPNIFVLTERVHLPPHGRLPDTVDFQLVTGVGIHPGVVTGDTASHSTFGTASSGHATSSPSTKAGSGVTATGALPTGHASSLPSSVSSPLSPPLISSTSAYASPTGHNTSQTSSSHAASSIDSVSYASRGEVGPRGVSEWNSTHTNHGMSTATSDTDIDIDDSYTEALLGSSSSGSGGMSSSNTLSAAGAGSGAGSSSRGAGVAATMATSRDGGDGGEAVMDATTETPTSVPPPRAMSPHPLRHALQSRDWERARHMVEMLDYPVEEADIQSAQIAGADPELIELLRAVVAPVPHFAHGDALADVIRRSRAS